MAKPVRYRVTVFIDQSCEQDWYQWMAEKHIPDVMETGYFSSYTIAKITQQSDEALRPDASGYMIEYTAPSQDAYNRYQELCAPALQKDHTDRYDGHFTAFRDLLEAI